MSKLPYCTSIGDRKSASKSCDLTCWMSPARSSPNDGQARRASILWGDSGYRPCSGRLYRHCRARRERPGKTAQQLQHSQHDWCDRRTRAGGITLCTRSQPCHAMPPPPPHTHTPTRAHTPRIARACGRPVLYRDGLSIKRTFAGERKQDTVATLERRDDAHQRCH